MDRAVIRGLDLTLRPGELTAVVGPNGCGKTTLLKIIAGVYEPSGGAVLLEGRPLREYSQGDYRDNVYIWGVSSVIHPLTVRENVAICRLSDSGDHGTLASALSDAGAEDIVRGLPQGTETMLTRVLEDGQQLSWGESLRIIIARALYARAEIMLIDEPALGLDRQAVQGLVALLKRLAKNRIVVLASHDPEIVSMADHVVELAEGAQAALQTARN